MSEPLFLDIVSGPESWLADPSSLVFWFIMVSVVAIFALGITWLILFRRRRKQKLQ